MSRVLVVGRVGSLAHSAAASQSLTSPQTGVRPRRRCAIRHSGWERTASGRPGLKRLRDIGVGRTRTGTHAILLVCDLEVRIADAVIGDFLRELTIDLDRDYQTRK